MKLRIFIIISIFLASSFSCHSQSPDERLIKENELGKITLSQSISIQKIKASNNSWNLLKEKLGPPEKVEEKDEFVEQTKTFFYKGVTFLYSNAGNPEDFTLLSISVMEPNIPLTINDTNVEVGDQIEKVTQWEHSINKADSTISLKVFATDSEGRIRYQDSGEKVRSENAFISIKYDPSTKNILKIKFMWRII